MQVVGYEPSRPDGTAALLVSAGETVERVPLEPGRELAYTLGERHCAGAVVDGEHRVCEAPATPYCVEHASTWVCAKCTGECLKAEMDCLDPHAIYLAAFAPDVVKVGVTREWRLETRLHEQGADRAAHLRTVEDGRIAREIEADIATRVPDRVRVPTKVAGLGETVDEAVWRDALAEFDPVERYELTYDLDLASRPVPEVLATGAVRGVKGRVLCLDRAGTTYAVDLRDLVGYDVTSTPSERDLQSSLAAFD